MPSQKKIGNDTEELVQEFLAQHGFWSTLLGSETGAQPCDIVAGKDNKILLLDAKHCSGDAYNLGRIEANQHSCFMLANECGVKNTGFAVFFEKYGIIKWLPYENAKKGLKQVKYNELDNFGDIICNL